MSDADPTSGTPAPRRAGGLRWQALFERVVEPLFVLDRRRRLIYANPAWERLTGLSAADARGLICRRPRPVAATDSTEAILAHAMTPPAEALEGQASRARRLLPGPPAGVRWWDLDFLPLRMEGETAGFFFLGRIVSASAGPSPGWPPLPERLLALRERVARRHGLELVGHSSPGMRQLAEQVRLAAQVRLPVLLVGEPGVGKRTVARVIHFQSSERERGLAVLDCERLPAMLLAGMLFDTRMPSPVPPGTLYLREPAALPRDLQERLCTWLARRQATAGETGPRLLAGCRTDPRTLVESGRLLEELRCLLSPLTLQIPPLRKRLDELPAVVPQLLARVAPDAAAAVPELADEVWEFLRSHAWPGNWRELLHVLAFARRHAKGNRIEFHDLPPDLRLATRLKETPGPATERTVALDQVLEQVERRLLTLALRRARGNKTKAAAWLGIWRPRLLRRLDALGLSSEGTDESD